MKIISNFHDYYDVMRTHDTDKLHIYTRKTEVVELKYPKQFRYDRPKTLPCDASLFAYEQGQLHTNIPIFRYEMFIIGFCGKFYFGFKYYYNSVNHSQIKYVNEKQMISIYEKISGGKKAKGYWHKNYVDEIKTMYSTDNTRLLVPLFQEYKTPVFVLQYHKDKKYNGYNHELVINPCLKDYEFYQVFVPYNAYQEIQMYVGNYLVEDPNKAWPISDKLKAQSKGFDKYSFRKDKSK